MAATTDMAMAKGLTLNALILIYNKVHIGKIHGSSPESSITFS